jgi:hypothetical protein
MSQVTTKISHETQKCSNNVKKKYQYKYSTKGYQRGPEIAMNKLTCPKS